MSGDRVLPTSWRGLERFAFGDTPEMADELLALVLAGTKTATCSAVSEHGTAGEPIDLTVGDRSVVLDGRGRRACVIETCEVTIKRFDEVDAAFAWDEGEGDRDGAWHPHRGSDVDIAVRLAPGPRGLERLARLGRVEALLTELLEQPVDVIEEPARSPHVQRAIDRDGVPAF